jgi:hypothetical protein
MAHQGSPAVVVFSHLPGNSAMRFKCLGVSIKLASLLSFSLLPEDTIPRVCPLGNYWHRMRLFVNSKLASGQQCCTAVRSLTLGHSPVQADSTRTRLTCSPRSKGNNSSKRLTFSPRSRGNSSWRRLTFPPRSRGNSFRRRLTFSPKMEVTVLAGVLPALPRVEVTILTGVSPAL